MPVFLLFIRAKLSGPLEQVPQNQLYELVKKKKKKKEKGTAMIAPLTVRKVVLSV